MGSTMIISSRRQLDLYMARKVMEWKSIPTEVLIDMGWSPTGKDEHAMIVFRKMCSIGAPWDLFEPSIFRDKIGDSQWHVKINSICRPMINSGGSDFGVAVCMCALSFLGVEIEFAEDEPQPVRYMPVMEAVGEYYSACIAAVGTEERLLECNENMLFSYCAKWLSKRDKFQELFINNNGHVDPLKVMLIEIEKYLDSKKV